MVETVRIRRMDGIVRDKAEPLDLRPFFQESDAAAPEAPAPGVWEGLDDWVPEPPPAQEEPETSVRNRPAPVPPG